jgi:hypothetical protein
MLVQPRWRIAVAALSLTALALASAPLSAAPLDVHVPPDTEMLVTVNVRQIVDSPLFKKHALGPAKDALKDLSDVEDILKDLGFDPFKNLDRIIAASPGGDKGLLIVHGKFDLAKFKAKGDDAARDNPDILKIHKIGDGGGGQFTVYEVVLPTDDDDSIFVSIPNDRTMLVSSGKDDVVEALKRGKGKKKATLKNKDFQALVEKMSSKQSVSVAALGKALKGGALDEAPKMVKNLVEKVEAVGGGITFGNDVRLELLVSTKTERDAKELRDGTNNGLKLALAALLVLSEDRKDLEALADMLKTIRITAKGKVVTFRARVSGELIQGALKKEE